MACFHVRNLNILLLSVSSQALSILLNFDPLYCIGFRAMLQFHVNFNGIVALHT